MIKNGKYFVPPEGDGSDFKALFKRLASAGAGRPVDKSGFPQGPWTPDLLAEAISQIEENRSGIELRTVQLWFQDNDKGVSSDNIRWLARIFGCDDPEATSEWQAQLSASQSRLIAERRARRGAADDAAAAIAIIDAQGHDETRLPRGSGLALRSEGLFNHESSLNLPVFVLAGSVTLGFIAYVMGVHSVTYVPQGGPEKQVGFLWAPNWTVLNMVLLPLYLIQIIDLVTFWKNDGRPGFSSARDCYRWTHQVVAFSNSYWTVLFVSFALVFLVQWSGVYLRALVLGDAGGLMIDWTLIAVERPDVISVPEAIVLTMLAFLYTGACVFLYLVGLILIYTLVDDLHENWVASGQTSISDEGSESQAVAISVLVGVFRSTVLGLLMILCIKLQAVYLQSEGTNIAQWIADDARSALGFDTGPRRPLGVQALVDFSSFLLLLTTVAIFLFGAQRLHRVLTGQADGARHVDVPWWKIVGTVLLLAVNFFLVGEITGFSIVLSISVALAIYSLFDPMFTRLPALRRHSSV